MELLTFVFAIGVVVSGSMAIWFHTKAGQRWIDSLPYYFSKADEQEMQVHNEPYYVKTDLERSITSRFRIFEAGEEAIKMSASTVLGKLKEQKVKGIENITINTFSKILTRLFGSPIHTNLGNLYAIREV